LANLALFARSRSEDQTARIPHQRSQPKQHASPQGSAVGAKDFSPRRSDNTYAAIGSSRPPGCLLRL